MEKEKVYLSESDKRLKTGALMKKYNLIARTALRAKKQGYFIPNYRKKTIAIDNQADFNLIVPMAKKAVFEVFSKYGNMILDQESFESDCLFRVFELSGHEKISKYSFLLGICYNVFNGLKNAHNKEEREGISFVSIDALESNQFDSGSDLTSHSMDKLKDHRSESSWFHSEKNPDHFYNRKWVVDRYNRQFARSYQG